MYIKCNIKLLVVRVFATFLRSSLYVQTRTRQIIIPVYFFQLPNKDIRNLKHYTAPKSWQIKARYCNKIISKARI